MTGRLLTAREVAGLLALTPETVLKWTRQGDLPAIRLPGGAIRFREADLDAWLAERVTQVAHLDNRASLQPMAEVADLAHGV